MSEEEVRRAGVLKRVKAGELSQVEAAEILGLSYRQVKRLYRRFRKLGMKALVHGNAGRRSNRARPAKERQRVLACGFVDAGAEAQAVPTASGAAAPFRRVGADGWELS